MRGFEMTVMIAFNGGFANALIRECALVMAAAARLTALAIVIFIFIAMRARFFFKKGETISDRNLIIIWVNFRKGQKSVAVAAIFYESGLQRGFNARDFR